MNFIDRFSKKYSDIKFHENLSSGSRIVLGGQMDKWTNMMKLIVAFWNFTNAPTKLSVLEAISHIYSSFTSISWALSFFINTIIWCASVVFALYVYTLCSTLGKNECMTPRFSWLLVRSQPGFLGLSDLLAPGLHGFGRAWFVDDVTTKVPMAAILLGLWMKPALEWGLVFCGYSGDWFVSEIKLKFQLLQ